MKTLPYLTDELRQAINYARIHKTIIVTCIDGFISDDEAKILRDMLWYAKANGVVVHFVADDLTSINYQKN